MVLMGFRSSTNSLFPSLAASCWIDVALTVIFAIRGRGNVLW